MLAGLVAIALTICHVGSSEANEPGCRLLDRLAYYPVIVEGEVLGVTPQYSMVGAASYWTLLEFRSTSYFRGGGPDTIHVQLRWINTDTLATFIDTRMLVVPRAGDAAILWISGNEYDALPSSLYPECEGMGTKPLFAELTSDLQVWPIIADSLPALSCSLDEGRKLIASAVDSSSIDTQIQSATGVVLGRYQDHAPFRRSSETYMTIRIASMPKGEAPSDSLVSIRIATKPPSQCHKTMALYPLMGPDSSGAFRPVHRNWPCFPVVDGQVIIGHRIVSGKPIDCLAPIGVLVEKVVETR